MMYPFMTLDDESEIVHSELLSSGRVKVYIEKPDENDCFHHMTCYLPDYSIDEVFGLTDAEVQYYMEILRSTAHLILERIEDEQDLKAYEEAYSEYLRSGKQSTPISELWTEFEIEDPTPTIPPVSRGRGR